ncbi:hypothetical protein RDWZM_008554 [Blomia tropicalis]|uniref:Phosphoenolpyruvate synthase-like protein n=1 Tax=Blomia tropicalis TaxID=40697 RepID=A0A9Q0M4G7_BLOTA|nr:hypothetical protein RDWZM_008554 [Blomia tropicalis]
MITLLIIWIAFKWKQLRQIHHHIKGRWYNYIRNWFTLQKYRKLFPKGRLDLHVWNNDDPKHRAIYPFPEEIDYEKPKKNQNEDLFVIGSNVKEKTTIEVYISRKPIINLTKDKQPKDKIHVYLNIRDNNNDVYTLDEVDVVDYSQTEYKACGLSFESLQPNKIARIKFRGYLKRNNEPELVFVRIRFLCLFYSKTFDHQRLFCSNFLAKELSKNKIDLIEPLLENKIEQFCQIKGTFQVETNKINELFFLGTVGRMFPKSNPITRSVTKICGFDKEGRGFQFGLVKMGQTKYRYGFMSHSGERFKLLTNITLTIEEMERLPLIDSYEFEVTFSKSTQNHKVIIKPWKDKWNLIKFNGIEGMCYIENRVLEKSEEVIPSNNERLPCKEMVVSLEQESSKSVELCGGKGASLARLRTLSKTCNEWNVPNAIVVTTNAHAKQIESLNNFQQKMTQLKNNVFKRMDVERTCNEMKQWFGEQSLNNDIKIQVIQMMENEFGNKWHEKKYAIRSSAVWEDSAEMSAAGQMTTFLGINGEQNVMKAIVKCWASQYGLVPIEYARGYGQPLDSLMAVVIQEMIDCDTAGVVFTASPIDGDERFMLITANFGLGESVVSASSDPDTFRLSVNIKSNSHESNKRSVKEIVERSIGKKALVTRLNSNPNHQSDDLSVGICNEKVDDNLTKQSVSDNNLISLGNICLQIHRHYGNPRDIEWGIKADKFYLLQSRPITNLDSNFTSYELMHEMDTPHMDEFEIYSRAHWGENFPGATSWIGAYNFLNGASWMRSQIEQGMKTAEDYNPFKPVLAFFGRHLTDPDILDAFKFMDANAAKPSLFVRIITPFALFIMIILNPRSLRKLKRRVFIEKFGEIVSKLDGVPLKDKQTIIYRTMQDFFPYMRVHGMATLGSSIKSLYLMKLFKSKTSNEQTFEHDHNLLMSHCNDVVSAEVPNLLRIVASQIEDKETFQNLSDQEALTILQDGKTEASKMFKTFLEKHGHRGYREFDPLYLTWGKNPLPCIQVIKSLLKNPSTLEPRKQKSIDELMNELHTPLTWWKRYLIKYWLLPLCRDGVGQRENTKSILIKIQDYYREAMWTLGENLLNEGILPEKDLIFYLKIDETQRLLNGERCPNLVMKARQRKRIYPEMDKLKFDEFIKGFRMAPKSVEKEIPQFTDDAFSLRGTAVTIGAIKARVCVAETIDEAINIKAGDILITYSTDIGWSPYFPLLSGIITEIGGTISHGAVIAREYGIPCLIAVEDACHHFKTGDIVYLDCANALVTKVLE